jgi:hypothetical protein
MDPSDEMPLRHEIKRLRERLEATLERHTAEFDSIRRSISELETTLLEASKQEAKPTAMQRAKIPTEGNDPAKVPPPLPKPSETPEPVANPEIVKPAKEASSPPPATPATPSALPRPDSSFELDFGKVWFVRIGVVILLTGLVFLGNYAYQNWVREMPNGVRLAALFACALALVETGRRLAAKENLNRFGEVLLAGGMAFFYYCTFAAHHVDRLKVIDSAAFAAVLLFGAAGAIAAVSWLRQAKVTATLGFVLAAYATMLQPIGWMSCVSNVLLGGMGLFFMLKPGWSGPGWASMLGSYCAFIGWQLLGASGRSRIDDPAVLWFLPPLWVMFSVPGIAGQFRESLSDRARAWFTALNNALFFLLFSAIWLLQNGDAEYWKVAAIFGPILIVLGIIGRRQDTTAGGVNISQGLAVATFALVLKLEGHHLALTLAAESLMLALAAWKYRGKSESVFALLAGLGSGFLVAHDAISLTNPDQIPIWSMTILAALLTAAAFVNDRIKSTHEIFAPFLRTSTALLLITSALVTSHLCLFRLGETAGVISAALLCGALSFGSLRLDPKRRLLEITWAALLFLGTASYRLFDGESAWPLTLAIESLALSVVAWKYRSRTEAIFAFLAGLSGAYLVAKNAVAFPPVERIPIWSASLIAIFIAAASVVSARIKITGEAFSLFLRFSTAVLFLLPTLIFSDLCIHELGETSALLTAVLLGGILPATSLKLDTKRLQPEIIWAGLWFLFLAAWIGFEVEAVWPIAIATAVSIASCWFWHRMPEENTGINNIDLGRNPTVPAWVYSIAAPLFIWQAGLEIQPGTDHLFLFCQIAALILAGAAVLLRCGRLVITASLLGFINLGLIVYPGVPENSHLFIAVALALAAFSMLRAPWATTNIPENYPKQSGHVFRLTAFVAYCVAWHEQSPERWADWLALTAIALTLFSVFAKRKILVEALGLIAVALVSLFVATVNSPWSISPDENSWRGITVVLALLTLTLTYRQRPALIENPWRHHEAIRLLAGLTCFVLTVWATQMLVWRFGWKPAAVLWTILGFTYVSAGLWQRLHIIRVSGFILLVLSLGKLFVSDVWDFTAFMRVVSFIVLGAALILLGLFYNKFAPAIKALLDDEKEGANR